MRFNYLIGKDGITLKSLYFHMGGWKKHSPMKVAVLTKASGNSVVPLSHLAEENAKIQS